MTLRIPFQPSAGEAPRAALARLAWMGFVGGIATALYAALAWAMTRAGAPVALASPLAYGLAAIWSYHGHRRLTFSARAPRPGAAGRFSAATLLGYAAAAAIPAALSGGLGLSHETSILAACLAVPALNALALSRIVFAERRPLGLAPGAGPSRR